MKLYTIRNNRLKNSYMEGFQSNGKDGVKGDIGVVDHLLLLPPIDGVEEDTKWGRLQAKIQLPKDGFYKIYAFASNDMDNYIAPEWGNIDDIIRRKNNFEQRREFFEREEWKAFIGKDDILLYDLIGKYLWIAIEVVGDGDCSIEQIVIRTPEDDFISFFPQIYQEWGGFLHRYLAIYHSIYEDFQEKCEATGQLFSADTAPKELLPVFVSWMGIDVDGNLIEEDILRKLVRSAYQLNKMKGTKWSVEELTRIVLDTTPTIVENNILREKDELMNRYGNSRFDLTIMIKKELTDNQKTVYYNLVKQFIPIRCSLHIYYLNDQCTLDDNTYLDLNAKVYAIPGMNLDQVNGMDVGAVLTI